MQTFIIDLTIDTACATPAEAHQLGEGITCALEGARVARAYERVFLGDTFQAVCIEVPEEHGAHVRDLLDADDRVVAYTEASTPTPSRQETPMSATFDGLAGAVHGAAHAAAASEAASVATLAAARRVIALSDDATAKRAASARAIELYETARRCAKRVWDQNGGNCNEYRTARKAEITAGEDARRANQDASAAEAALWLAQRELPAQAEEASRLAVWASGEAARAMRCLENVRREVASRA